MKVMQVTLPASGFTVVEAEVPQPQPGDGELLVRVHAAGVTPTELGWYPTSHTVYGEKRTRAIPGHEFSGVVAAIGRDVKEFGIGDEVFGMNDWFAEGATAEYCLAKPLDIARKPKKLTHEAAATVPVGALTAWQGLFDRAKLQPGEQVLVHGGSGSVGLFAVQLAHNHGAHVVATASAKNLAFVERLGADQVCDYKSPAMQNAFPQVDVVFDTVGGETRRSSWGLLKPNGRMITVAADAETIVEPRLKEAFFIVEPKQSQLLEVSKRIENGSLQTFVNAVVPFNDAPAAYAGRIQEKRGYGKIVISVIGTAV